MGPAVIFKNIHEREIIEIAKLIVYNYKYSTSPKLEQFKIYLLEDGSAELAAKTYLIAYFLAKDPNTGESRDEDTIIECIKKAPRFFDIYARYVVSVIRRLKDLGADELSSVSSGQAVIPYREVKDYFYAYAEIVKKAYINMGLIEELRLATTSGIDSFGLWILEAENVGRMRVLFDTDGFYMKELKLSTSETIEYFYFIAVNAIKI